MSLRSGIDCLTSSLGSGLAPVWKLYQRQIYTASSATKIHIVHVYEPNCQKKDSNFIAFICFILYWSVTWVVRILQWLGLHRPLSGICDTSCGQQSYTEYTWIPVDRDPRFCLSRRSRKLSAKEQSTLSYNHVNSKYLLIMADLNEATSPFQPL